MKQVVVRVFYCVFLGVVSLGALSACEERKGPAERLGERIDEGVNDTKRAIKDAAD